MTTPDEPIRATIAFESSVAPLGRRDHREWRLGRSINSKSVLTRCPVLARSAGLLSIANSAQRDSLSRSTVVTARSRPERRMRTRGKMCSTMRLKVETRLDAGAVLVASR